MSNVQKLAALLYSPVSRIDNLQLAELVLKERAKRG
jgi:hypothetical protein